MHICVVAHGLLTVAVQHPGGGVELAVPDGTDIQGLLEVLYNISPVFDPRATPIVVIDGAQVPLSQTLHGGEAVHLYPIFGGG